MDPDHPNTRHFQRVIGELWAEYIRAHTLEECQELCRRVERNRLMRQKLLGTPRPTAGHGSTITGEKAGNPAAAERRVAPGKEEPSHGA